MKKLIALVGIAGAIAHPVIASAATKVVSPAQAAVSQPTFLTPGMSYGLVDNAGNPVGRLVIGPQGNVVVYGEQKPQLQSWANDGRSDQQSWNDFWQRVFPQSTP